MVMQGSSRSALRRARLRKKSAGAAMFVVAITLGLLAAMGVYGLSATASDVRAAGHGREAAQAHAAAELAIIEAASALGPGTASLVVRTMQGDDTVAARGRTCRSAKPFTTTNDADRMLTRTAEACMVLGASQMKKLSPNPLWIADNGAGENPIPFSPRSFGDVPLKPTVRVELTNPIDWDSPAGYMVGGGSGARPPIFTQIRATVYLELRPDGLNKPADIIATGRGRLVVGPYTP